jgi:hypothetical protein
LSWRSISPKARASLDQHGELADGEHAVARTQHARLGLERARLGLVEGNRRQAAPLQLAARVLEIAGLEQALEQGPVRVDRFVAEARHLSHRGGMEGGRLEGSRSRAGGVYRGRPQTGIVSRPHR